MVTKDDGTGGTVHYAITKWSSTFTMIWSIRLQTPIASQSITVSPDQTYLIFTDGVSILTKANYDTGAIMNAENYDSFE
jgi:hypothetical protein